jgi:hypothetical protein
MLGHCLCEVIQSTTLHEPVLSQVPVHSLRPRLGNRVHSAFTLRSLCLYSGLSGLDNAARTLRGYVSVPHILAGRYIQYTVVAAINNPQLPAGSKARESRSVGLPRSSHFM